MKRKVKYVRQDRQIITTCVYKRPAKRTALGGGRRKKNTVVLISTFHGKDMKTKMKNYLYKVNLLPGSFDKSKIWHQKKPTYKTETDSQTREQTCGCRRGSQQEKGWNESLGLADANYYI